MRKPVILYSSADIHSRIKRVLGQPGKSDKRVAIVAYVGSDGAKYLPHPEGLRVVCNPSAGGTDPDTLRHLINNEARVEVSDNLHMKVYWSRNRGCVITSANASSNALGRGGLKEAGIWLPPGSVDIQRLLRYAHPRKIRESDLHQLDRETRAHRKTSPIPRKKRKAPPDFLKWYHSPHRSEWKMNWSEESVTGNATSVKEQTSVEYGHKEPWIWACCVKGRVRANDWLLTYIITEKGAKNISWLFVDFVVKLRRSEKKYYDSRWPYHAVQVFQSSKYQLPPFRIDAEFRRAFAVAVKRYTADKLIAAKKDIPAKRFLRYIADAYRLP